MLRGMLAALFFLTAMATLGAAAPHAWKVAQPHLAKAGTRLALRAGLEPLPGTLPQAGILTEVEALELAPIFRPEAPSYEPPDDFERHETASGMIWRALAPDEVAAPPLVVLLHGSGRDGRSMLDMWRKVGASEGVLLVAPDAAESAGWSVRDEGEATLDTLLDAVAERHSFDRTRVFLYGHSAGASHALRLAGGGTGPWRAVAGHAGTVSASDVRRVAGGVPIRIQAGAEDDTVPLDQVRASARTLAHGGHATELAVIPRHDHWFYAVGPRLAADAWSFFARS